MSPLLLIKVSRGFCYPTEMETIDGNSIPTETLSGVSSSSQPPGPPHITMKPTSEELFGSDLGPEIFGGDLGSENGDGAAVVVTTVVEKTEVTVVTIVEENKDDTSEHFDHSVTEKKENNNEAKENEKDGVFGHLFDGDEGMNVNYNNEAKENEKEEVFGHLFDGDEGMNVNYNNETKENVKEGVFGHLFDGDEGINVNFSQNGNEEKLVLQENTGGDLMDVCLSDQKEENPKNFTGVFESTEDINTNKNNEENVQNGENDVSKLPENNESEEEEEEEEHDFVVGDFVWGKIKSHPWWPGQIYDPSDASNYATSIKRKGHLLVAYFGDGSFSWCSPSQLKPFIDNFQEMSNQSDSKKFVHAVRTALEAVSEQVESELICKCQAVDRVDRAVNADVANSGIKPGVRVPKGNTIKTLIERMNPIELLLNLNSYATFEPGSRMVDLELELTMVKSWLSVFYLQKGGYVLPEYYDPKCIEGLEDNWNVPECDMNGPENVDDKLYQKRKQKSVAELLSVEDEPKIKKAKAVKDGGSGRKRKAALVVDITPESDHESGGGSGGGGGVEEDMMCSPRQRKKSKYLSPPYLSPTIWTGKLSGSGSGSFKEPKPEPEKEKEKEKEKVVEMAAKQLEETSSRRKPRQKRRSSDDQDSKDEGKSVIDAGVNVDKVLNGLLLAALDPSGSVEKKKLSVFTGFVSSFRSSVFENGSKLEPDPDVVMEEESDVGFVKRKMEEMMEMVKGFEEDEMSGEVKGKLEGVIMQVLERVK
ncbi:hypothetical protein L1887_36710 [Cichorium endivia]|nr:hypothetical protein L1887_36710 [Cichorium endivia]